MTEERLSRQEEHSDNDGTAQQEIPNPMDSIMKEVVQLRKENKKLHRRLTPSLTPKQRGVFFARGSVHLSILVVQ